MLELLSVYLFSTELTKNNNINNLNKPYLYRLYPQKSANERYYVNWLLTYNEKIF